MTKERTQWGEVSGSNVAELSVAVPAEAPAAPVAVAVGARAALLWEYLKGLVKTPFYAFYLRRLRSKSKGWKHPHHLGIIMDGNRRFAQRWGLRHAIHGHRRGAEKLREVLEWCRGNQVKVVTVWCFSLENFQRSNEEVEALLGLFEDKTREMAEDDHVHDHRIRVRYIGRLELLPDSLRREIARVEELTAEYDQFELNIAMAYGGRQEIADAFRRHIAERTAQGAGLDEILAGLDAHSIDPYLYTSGQPEPDLILRTSGEVRLSGFLLWQSAYSEFYFCDSNWPAFREIDFLRALRAYDERQRRFGR
jgi:short-chain Z-isoprenyl diphosphate synthase